LRYSEFSLLFVLYADAIGTVLTDSGVVLTQIGLDGERTTVYVGQRLKKLRGHGHRQHLEAHHLFYRKVTINSAMVIETNRV
jgi:hypothetical protein